MNDGRIVLKAPCAGCGGLEGVIREKNGQDTVWCLGCGKYTGWNASRVATGRSVRSVSTVHAAIKPKQRARILARSGAKCEVCGKRNELHVGHILSVSVGLTYGLTEALLNDDENLLALCPECNLGQGAEPMPFPLAVSILRARVSWREAQP